MKQTHPLSKDERKSAIVLTGIALPLTITLLFRFISDPENFFSEFLGIHSNVFNNMSIWIYTSFIILVYILYTLKVIPFVREKLFTFSWFKVIGIWTALTSSTLEEILFRQRLMDWLMNLGLSIGIQILLSAIVFGLAHSAWILLRGEIKIAFPVIASTAVLGGALAVLYIYSGRQVFPPIVAHVVINLFIEPWLILAAVSGKFE